MGLLVQRIQPIEAKPFILDRHYAHRMPCVTDAYGAFVDGQLCGICTFGMPASPSLCVGVCGENLKDYVLELNRFCVSDGAKFQRSAFLSRSLRRLGRVTSSGGYGGRIIVSYADTAMGHVGTIYQATNFLYTGATKERTDIGTGDGSHSRHYDKSRDYSKDRQHRSSKHRYVTFVGNRRWKNMARSELRYEIQPYPLGKSDRYDTSEPINTQALLFDWEEPTQQKY